MRLLIVTAVDAEARAIAANLVPTDLLVTSGIGRTNAAAATTEAALKAGPFDAVLSCGVAGALPGGDLDLGDAVLATACVYAEEGLVTPDGFGDMTVLGFPLGDFDGNNVPVDTALHAALRDTFPCGPIVTVATCSGTDEQAACIAARTGARAEAMEGAAVVHAARRLGIPAIELRTISNHTGDRAAQRWDLPAALAALREAVAATRDVLR